MWWYVVRCFLLLSCSQHQKCRGGSLVRGLPDVWYILVMRNKYHNQENARPVRFISDRLFLDYKLRLCTRAANDKSKSEFQSNNNNMYKVYHLATQLLWQTRIINKQHSLRVAVANTNHDWTPFAILFTVAVANTPFVHSCYKHKSCVNAVEFFVHSCYNKHTY